MPGKYFIKVIYAVIFGLLFTQPIQAELQTLIHDDIERTYIVHEPDPPVTNKLMSLMICLHGYTGTAAGSQRRWGLDTLANQEGFMTVYPNALAYPTNQRWNVGERLNELTNGTDDVGFISQLIDTMIANYPIDPSRVFVTGHSNGGFMAYRLACMLSSKIAAIAPVAGQQVSSDCHPVRPVPILHIHALNDGIVSYYGSGYYVQPVEEVITQWAVFNKCDTEPDTILNENGVVARQWSSVDHSGDIFLYTTSKGGHAWLTPGNSGLNSNALIWDFFSSRSLTSVVHVQVRNEFVTPEKCILWQNYPNPMNPETTIQYQILQNSDVLLRIVNTNGQIIDELVNTFQSAGSYQIHWNGNDLPSGLYIMQLTAGKTRDVKKILITR